MSHRTTNLADISEIVSKGTTPTSVGLEFQDSGVPFVRSEDVLGGLVSHHGVTRYISAHAHKVLKRSALQSGDVLVTIAGTIGRVGYVGSDVEELNCNQAVAFIRLHPKLADPAYVCMALQSPAVKNLFDRFVAGGAIPNVNLEQIRSISIPHPDLPRQRQIAASLQAQLATVEQARSAARAQLSDMRQLTAAIVDAAFAETSEAAVVRIGAAAKVQSGYAFKSTDFKKSGVRLLRNANVLPGRVYWDDAAFLSSEQAAGFDRYALNEHDILISLDRPIISSGIKVARVGAGDLPALLVQRVGRFEVDGSRLVADYLHAFLQSHRFIEAISGHDQSLGVPHISPGQVEAIELPLPSVEDQRRIVARLTGRLSAIEPMRAAAQAQLAEIEALPARLLEQAFNPTDEGTSP